MTQVDVVIVGGGPSGSTAARRVALHGRSVALLEKTDYKGFRIGETLAPENMAYLMDHDLEQLAYSGPHVVAPGLLFSWESPVETHKDFGFNPHGDGLHLDRAAFDHRLALAAKKAGAALSICTQIQQGIQHEEGWTLTLKERGECRTIHARFLMEATGRQRAPLRPFLGKRQIYDRQTAVAVIADAADEDHRTLITACPEGWWYAAPVPGNKRVAVFLTDPDLMQAAGGPQQAWRKALPPSIAQRLKNLSPTPTTRVFAANGTFRTLLSDESRLVIGDAAWSSDPLSGAGIHRAMTAATAAADAVHHTLSGDSRAHHQFASMEQRAFIAQRHRRAAFYALAAQRFNSPYWQRRSPNF